MVENIRDRLRLFSHLPPSRLIVQRAPGSFAPAAISFDVILKSHRRPSLRNLHIAQLYQSAGQSRQSIGTITLRSAPFLRGITERQQSGEWMGVEPESSEGHMPVLRVVVQGYVRRCTIGTILVGVWPSEIEQAEASQRAMIVFRQELINIIPKL